MFMWQSHAVAACTQAQTPCICTATRACAHLPAQMCLNRRLYQQQVDTWIACVRYLQWSRGTRTACGTRCRKFCLRYTQLRRSLPNFGHHKGMKMPGNPMPVSVAGGSNCCWCQPVQCQRFSPSKRGGCTGSGSDSSQPPSCSTTHQQRKPRIADEGYLAHWQPQGVEQLERHAKGEVARDVAIHVRTGSRSGRCHSRQRVERCLHGAFMPAAILESRKALRRTERSGMWAASCSDDARTQLSKARAWLSRLVMAIAPAAKGKPEVRGQRSTALTRSPRCLRSTEAAWACDMVKVWCCMEQQREGREFRSLAWPDETADRDIGLSAAASPVSGSFFTWLWISQSAASGILHASYGEQGRPNNAASMMIWALQLRNFGGQRTTDTVCKTLSARLPRRGV